MSGARIPNAVWSSWFTHTNPTSTIKGNNASPPLTSEKKRCGRRGKRQAHDRSQSRDNSFIKRSPSRFEMRLGCRRDSNDGLLII